MGLVETTLRDPAASTALAAEVARLLVKGAITVVPPHESHLGFYSRYFLVSKKSGEKRPILDLRVFNRFVAARKFRMLTVGALLRCVREGDWFTSLDLKDAYFHVPIRRSDHGGGPEPGTILTDRLLVREHLGEPGTK